MNTTSAVVKIGPEKIQACMGFEPMTSAIPVQCSTNWANKPSKLWVITQNWNDESDILFQQLSMKYEVYFWLKVHDKNGVLIFNLGQKEGLRCNGRPI